MVRCVYNLVYDLGHTASIYTSLASLDDKRIVRSAPEVCSRGLLQMSAPEARSLPIRLRKLTRKVSKVESSVPFVKRTNDVKGFADDVNDVDDQDDAHYHSSLTNLDLVRGFDLPGHDNVVEDALAQDAEGLRLMQNEDH
ncbi:hypothetical protein Tco_0777398 [Tanacetum coccineum]